MKLLGVNSKCPSREFCPNCSHPAGWVKILPQRELLKALMRSSTSRSDRMEPRLMSYTTDLIIAVGMCV